jgi:hypothetical protein
MNYVGAYKGRQVYWLDFDQYTNVLPSKDWLCLAIADTDPDMGAFDKFVRAAIDKGILEFKGCGKYGEKLHDLFDETVVIMQVLENHPEFEVMTTWHNGQTLAHVFWQCFFVTCLPETADLDSIKIVCTDLDGINKADELKLYLATFEVGWLPPD